MIPFFLLTAGPSGSPVHNLNDRLLSVTVVDNAGFQNDRLIVSIDDRPDENGKYIKIPVRGDKISAFIGYTQDAVQVAPSGMWPMGDYIIDEIEAELKADVIMITAHATDTNNKFKEGRSKAFHRTTLGEIVKDCAQYCGMTAAVHPTLKDKKIEHEDQLSQSCAEFLRVLGERNNGVMKVQKGKILFAPKDKLSEVGDTIRPQVTVRKESLLPGSRYVSIGKAKYVAVKANYQTPDQKNSYASTQVTIKDAIGRQNGDTSEGVTGPTAVYLLQGVFHNEQEAKIACYSKMKSLALSECGLGFSCIGNPKITAESEVTMQGLRPGIQTKWIAIRVTHTIDSTGYKTEVQCESPEKVPEEEDASTPEPQTQETQNTD